MSGGCPAYKMSFDLTVNGVWMSQTSVGISGDMDYTVSFVDVSGGSWAQAFADSVASLTAVPVA